MLHSKPGLLGMDWVCILSTASPQWNMATSLRRAYKQFRSTVGHWAGCSTGCETNDTLPHPLPPSQCQVEEFGALALCEKEANARYQLWKGLFDFMDKSNTWTEDPILDEESNEVKLSIEQIKAEVEDYASRAYKMGKQYKEDQVCVGGLREDGGPCDRGGITLGHSNWVEAAHRAFSSHSYQTPCTE